MAHLNRKIGIPSFDDWQDRKTGDLTGLGVRPAMGRRWRVRGDRAFQGGGCCCALNENYCKGGRAFGLAASWRTSRW